MTRGAAFREACPARDNPGPVTSLREKDAAPMAPSTRRRGSAALEDAAPLQRGCRIRQRFAGLQNAAVGFPTRPWEVSGGEPACSPVATATLRGARGLPRPNEMFHGTSPLVLARVQPSVTRLVRPASRGTSQCRSPAQWFRAPPGRKAAEPPLTSEMRREGKRFFCPDTSPAAAPGVPRGPAPRNARAGIAAATKAPS